MVEVFFNYFIVYYGIFGRIYFDQGVNFESKVIKELCVIIGMSKLRMISYYVIGNGMCEWFNCILLNMLGFFLLFKKVNWKVYVNLLVYVYNCICYESIGQMFYLLMFGRNFRLFVDVVFGFREYEKEFIIQYVVDL